MAPPSTLLWFRQDLRLDDNPALAAAVARGGPVVPVYVWDEAGEGAWRPGRASRAWLRASLRALAEDLRGRGGRLIVARGDAGTELERIRAATGAAAVYWNRRYEPAVQARDAGLKERWRARGVAAESHAAGLLHEPHTVRNRQGGPFQVFTPYWRHCSGRPVDPPVASTPARWPAPTHWPESLTVEELALTAGGGGPDLTGWTPGEAGAQQRLRRFIREGLSGYDTARDFPGEPGTSRLSPHLHFGELGPRQIWAAVRAVSRSSGVFPPGNGARVFLAELGWREFAHHLLYHFPDTPERPKRPAFAAFPWRPDPEGRWREAWTSARTGYPIVDAGLRELAATGWMHNRVRMIVASFLVKHLRRPWQEGAAHFWDGLFDADLANNTLGWQWSAGCGADAAPYFRIFNPVAQAQRYDPEGSYVRRWVPELDGLSGRAIHAPWQAGPVELAAAGVTLGRSYPHPVVDHATARAEALAAFQSLRHE